MKLWLTLVVVFLVPSLAGAQPILEFRNDLAFKSADVNSFAAQTYRKRLHELAAANKLDRNPDLLKRLHTLIDRLLPSAEYERPSAAKLPWEIHVCRDCNENASAMAGGKMLVSEEFITQINLSDDELGYLLAHEMGHVLAEHTRESATSARYFVGMGLKRDYPDIQHEMDESFSLMLRMAPFYQQQEMGADYIGYILGARAGFEPHAMLSLLRKLDNGGKAMFDVHPDSQRRLQHAETILPAGLRLYQQGNPAR